MPPASSPLQKRNTILFVIISVLILVGWGLVQTLFFPPKPTPTPEPKPVLRDVKAGELIALTIADGGNPGPDNLGRVLVDLWLASNRLPNVEPAPGDLVAGLVGVGGQPGPDSLGRIGAELARLKAKDPRLVHVKEERKASAPVFVELGDGSNQSKFHLKVVLTTDGGAVLKIILNKFKRADGYGKPARVPPFEQELLPGVEGPSYLLYHYARPNDAAPVDTLGKIPWILDEDQTRTGPDDNEHRAVFYVDVPDQAVRLTKTYTLKPGEYHLGLSIKVQSTAGADAPSQTFRYQLAGAHGLPIEGLWYTSIYRNAVFGLDSGGTAERSLEDARQISHWQGGSRFDRSATRRILYAAVAVQYFASAIVVDQKANQPTGKDNFIEWARATLEAAAPNPNQQGYLDDITVRVNTEAFALEPGNTAGIEHRYVLYNGPVKTRLLDFLEGNMAVSKETRDFYDQLQLNTMQDYPSSNWFNDYIGGPTRWTWLLIYCTNIMHWLLWALHKFLPMWLCIILLTILVRGTLYPLSRRQAINAQRMQEKMAKLAPEIKKIKEKYANDFGAMQQAQNELMRKHGINPISQLGGCFLLFLQMPIFLGLYYCLQESIQFRLEPFLWIENLGAPDMLVWWTENIPWISTPTGIGGFLYLGPYFNLLPVIAVALMIVQQKLTLPPPTDEQQEMQQKMMKYMMIVFGIFFYKVAAGLCIYFIASSLWGLAERKLLPKKKTEPAAAPPKTAGGERSGGTARLKPKSPKGAPNGALKKLREWWEEILKKASKK